MRMKITKKHVALGVALAAAGVMSAATLAWAAPNITSGTTPPSSHNTDGRALRDCTDCHQVTVVVPAPEPTMTPVPTATPEPTVTPAPDDGQHHGKAIGHHKGDSNNAKQAAHDAQKPKKAHKAHKIHTQDSQHTDSREFGRAGGRGSESHND